jgi:RsiW-degrading membrane proteinase PrsW (M82 family)
MLQRIQSIYLLAASVVMFGLFLFPLAHNIYVDGKLVNVTVTGVYEIINGQEKHIETFTALTAVTAIIALAPLAVIFMYKNRKKQINFCYIAILALIGYSFWMAQTSAKLSPVTVAFIFASSSSANSGLSSISCLTASRPWPRRVSP